MADTATLMMTMENGDDGGGSTKTITQSDGLILVTPCLPHTPHKWYSTTHVPESLHLSSDSDTILTLSAHPVPTSPPQDQTPVSMLAHACTVGDVEGLLEVVDKGGKVNKPVNSAGLLGLHLAASRGHIEVVVVLVDRVGAIVDMPDASNETALLKAAYNGHADVVSFLLERNADPNHKDRDGWTALHNCASRGFYSAAVALIEGGADVNAQSGTGFTPLMNAASKGFIDIIQLLLTSYADPVIKNSYGDSAYDLAAQSEEAYGCEILLTAEQHKQVSKSPTPAPSHSTVLELIHEYQRSSLFSTSRFSPDNLTRHDRPAWTRASTNEECRLQDVGLPRDWFWVTEWRIDLKHPGVDGDGWEYAREVDGTWGKSVVGSAIVGGWVRRRRWIRVRKMRVDADSIGEGTRGVKVVTTGATEADYIVRAELALESLRSAVLKAVSPIVGVKEDLRRYEEAIQILLSGIKSDTDNERKTKASEIVLSYLNHAEGLSEQIAKLEGKSSGAGGSI